jgi:hypothetical protein
VRRGRSKSKSNPATRFGVGSPMRAYAAGPGERARRPQLPLRTTIVRRSTERGRVNGKPQPPRSGDGRHDGGARRGLSYWRVVNACVVEPRSSRHSPRSRCCRRS